MIGLIISHTVLSTSILLSGKCYFCLDFDEKVAFVFVADKNMQEIAVDYHSYNGDTFNVLRSLDTIREKNLLCWPATRFIRSSR